jgi:glutathione synthase
MTASKSDVPSIWTLHEGDQPLIAFAIHDGHAVRRDVASRLALGAEDRRREEDPSTAGWAKLAPTWMLGTHSRFQVDLNRPRETAVYRGPEHAWGLQVWKDELDPKTEDRSLAEYDAFYAEVERVVGAAIERHGRVLILDLHSYNHRREGPEAQADPEHHPQVNVGTGSLDRRRWAPVIDRFVDALRAQPFPSGELDVRENVRFRGGHLSRWIVERFPRDVCVLALEVKKFFMDEWTGQLDEGLHEAIGGALMAAAGAGLEELPRVSTRPKRSRAARTLLHSQRNIRIGFVVNDIATEQPGYTTVRLAMAAIRAGHEAWFMGVGDLAYDPDEHIRARATTVPPRKYKDGAAFLADLRGRRAIRERITADQLDVLMLRNDPAPDAIIRPWASQAGIIFGRVARRRGTIVVNDPDGLARANSKMYFQAFPEEVRPRTLITRNADDIKAFVMEQNGKVVLKPLTGSGGQSVFLVEPQAVANMNQMIDAVARDGFVIAQEYLPQAEQGDMRLFVMNGEPLMHKGRYAAFRRVRMGGDLRSNIHAGGKLAQAEVTSQALELVEMVRPKLVQDGMFLVGLDVVGDKLMEINVFSPGGLGSAQKFERVDFSDAVIRALERKVGFMAYYRRDFDNSDIATL